MKRHSNGLEWVKIFRFYKNLSALCCIVIEQRDATGRVLLGMQQGGVNDLLLEMQQIRRVGRLKAHVNTGCLSQLRETTSLLRFRLP